ncbi:MAG: hypothetical protein IPN77_30720 [Sandaracinaceae bacterium]|nr:hypothetical protein [Sandaracinaceae bacterium]
MASTPFGLEKTYVHLTADGGATPIPVTPDFWASLATRYDLDEGFLVTRMPMTEDWPHWEMHPEGEEVVILLSGAVDLLLDGGTRQWTVELRPETNTWINPRGVWHRGLVREPSELMFITAGRGTEHRAA